MPHVVVKLWPGETEAQKQELAERIVRDVTEVFGLGRESVSVAMEEIEPGRWAEEVYRREILNGTARLYQKPGYRM